MIRIRIELLPANGGRVQLLGLAVVANDGQSRDPARGNYDAVFATRTGKTWKVARVENYPRQAYQVWVLLYRLLRAAMAAPDSPERDDA